MYWSWIWSKSEACQVWIESSDQNTVATLVNIVWMCLQWTFDNCTWWTSSWGGTAAGSALFVPKQSHTFEGRCRKSVSAPAYDGFRQNLPYPFSFSARMVMQSGSVRDLCSGKMPAIAPTCSQVKFLSTGFILLKKCHYEPLGLPMLCCFTGF